MYDDEKTLGESASFAAPGAPSIAVRGATLPLVEEGVERVAAFVPTLRQHLGRLIRYSATSGIALGVSEATLLALYASRTFNATVAAVVANLAGTIPSYLLSRYWIWSDADRQRAGRQVVLYWTTALISMTVTSLATGALASIAPAGHKAHILVAGVGFFGVSVVLWVSKYVVYQKIIFRDHPAEASIASS